VTDSGFFVLRTPLLPFDELLNWSKGLAARNVFVSGLDSGALTEAWTSDIQLLRTRLRDVVDRPEVAHALFIASPSLQNGIAHWRRDPDSKKGMQAERALVRYFERMSSRSTPFGLFSGCSVGIIDAQKEPIALLLEGRDSYRTACRLDFDYLFALMTRMARDSALAMELPYWPNSSIYRVADRWHYVESRLSGTRRTHHLVSVANDKYLDAALERAQTGATLSELTEAVLKQSTNSDVTDEEATQYSRELIENDVLVSRLSPLLTGQAPLDDLIGQMEALQSGGTIAGRLKLAREQMVGLDKKSLSATETDYRAITSTLQSLPNALDLEPSFQLDMFKPVQRVVLGKTVIDEITKGIEILCRLRQTSEPEELVTFRAAFSARYERAMVPILEALDEDVGVGFGRSGAEPSPLLTGLRLGRHAASGRSRLAEPRQYLLKELMQCVRRGDKEMDLNPADLGSGDGDLRLVPDSFSVLATLVAPSVSHLERGEFELHLKGGGGPSGARMLGRFCYADAELETFVREDIRREESNNLEAVYAEIVYLPETKIGNVLCRPLLRGYEIQYLGRSGAPQNRQLPMTDLMIRLDGERIVLYSKRLRREVIPRLTSAASFTNPQMAPVYRFLCYLQHQHGSSLPSFSWGYLDTLEFLPRVRTGRVVLSPAKWRLSKEEIKDIAKHSKSALFVAIQELRGRRGLPRWIVFQESDSALTVDLDNALSVDAFVHVLKRSAQATLLEMYPSPDQLCVTSPEGRYAHELILPFRRQRFEGPEKPAKREQKPPPILAPSNARRRGPGSEWLYVKLYASGAALDEVLTTSVASVARAACSCGAASRWFFIRYADPQPHLRVRFNGIPDRLRREVFPLASEAFNPLVECGKLWKIQFDTYDREIERYGGLEGITASEDIFFADSEAVVEVLQVLGNDTGLDGRWRIALLGADLLLTDCGFDQVNKKAVLETIRKQFHNEFDIGTSERKRLGDRYRVERKNLEALLAYSPNHSAERELAEPIFSRRSARTRAVVNQLRALAGEGKLFVDLTELVSSYLHMHVNRLIRSSQRAHEVVLYDFLFRLYEAETARANSVGCLK
jgi:thiopeptide-type bacteriocin biosynthesis protein